MTSKRCQYRRIIEKHPWYFWLVPDQENPFKKSLIGDYPITSLKDKLVVCYTPKEEEFGPEVQRLYAVFESYIEFYLYRRKWKEDFWCFYEVIMGEHPQKPHFDIDINDIENIDEVAKNTINNLITACIMILKEYNVNINISTDILLYSSHGEFKRSFHLVINNICHLDNIEAKAFYEKVISYPSMKPYIEFIDRSVYSPRQQFRILNCHKVNDNRAKIFEEKFIYEGIEYTHIYHENVSGEQLECVKLYESLVGFIGGALSLRSFSNYKSYNRISEDITDDIVSKSLELLHQVINPCPFTLLKVVDNIIILRRLKPSKCNICERIHQHENPFITINNDSVYLDCRRRSKDKPQLLLGLINRNSTVIERFLIDEVTKLDNEYDLISDQEELEEIEELEKPTIEMPNSIMNTEDLLKLSRTVSKAKENKNNIILDFKEINIDYNVIYDYQEVEKSNMFNTVRIDWDID